MPPPLSPFAERLHLHRKRAGWSQDQLADHVGTSQATISEWERGKSSPSVPELIKLCGLFTVSADYLIGRSDFPHGLAPDTWIADEDAIAYARAHPKERGVRWAFKVPRKLRMLEHHEYESLGKELGSM